MDNRPTTEDVGVDDSARPLRQPHPAETSAVAAEIELQPLGPEGGASSSSSTSTGKGRARDAPEVDGEVLGSERVAADNIGPPTEKQELVHNLDLAKDALQNRAVFVSASDYPILRLANIRLIGSPNIRPSFLARLCLPYVDPTLSSSPLQRWLHATSSQDKIVLPPPGAPTTLPGLLHLAQNLASDVQKLDIYSNIDVSLEPALVPSSPATAMQDVDLLFTLKEAPRFFLKSSTDVGNGEGSVSLQGRIRNLFGGAEKLEGSYEMGTRTKRGMNINFTTPILSSPAHAFSLSSSLSDRDQTFYSSCYSSTASLRSAVTANTGPSTQHEFAYELSWNTLDRLTPTASLAMRKLAGHHIKSSLVHTYLKDDRDAPLLGTAGSLTKSVSEYAGLGGDASFLKWSGESAINRRFSGAWSDWGWSIGARAGLIKAFGTPSSSSSSSSSRSTLPHQDRFQLGGPTSVRLFKLNSLGPKAGIDSLGGTFHYELGSSLLAPIPTKPHWPLRVQAFANMGQVGEWEQCLTRSTSTSKDQRQPPTVADRPTVISQFLPSSSVGLGLLYEQGPLRLEVNAGMPVSARKTDGVRKGVQVGIGISFLG